jgi:hypothetical protein
MKTAQTEQYPKQQAWVGDGAAASPDAKQAQLEKNLAALPDICFGLNHADKSLIMIKAGEKGYYPTKGFKKSDAMTFDEMANHLNEGMDVTPCQRAAMEHGSVFGFDLPIAHPDIFKLDFFIRDLDEIDASLGIEARKMRQGGAGYDEIRDRFKGAILAAAGLREQAA